MDVATLESMPRDQLEAEITELAGHLAAAECRWLLLVAEYDRRAGWLEWGCRSCVQWLGWKCGMAARPARDKLRVAHALSLFPHVREAFTRGRLSYSKARAIVRCGGPDTEKDLVEMAVRATAGHMESIARGYRRVERSEDGQMGTLATRRRVVFDEDADDPDLGVVVAHLTHEERELLHKALSSPGDDVSFADAMVMMAESFLAHGSACRPGNERTTVIVNVDEAVLCGDDRGVSRIEGGAALPPATARRLACDATFTWMLRGSAGELVDVSSKHGSIPRAVRRFVRARDDGRCRFPGCAERRFVDVHHIVHRAEGGTNDVHNLTTLCWFHHRLVHEGGWSIERHIGDGEVIAIRPSGDRMTGAVPSIDDTDGDRVEELNAHHRLAIDARTVVPMWGGERLDLGWAVTSLWCTNHGQQQVRESAAA